MDVQVNWLAVLLATASSMVVGGIWYAKPVLGRVWMKHAHITDKQMQKGNAKAMIITVALSFFTAFALAHVIFLANTFFGNSFLHDAVTTTFWLWLGLTAARFITHDLFERRPIELTLLNVFHEFVTLMVMAVVIGLFKP